MPMNREEHEAMLNELLSPELEQSRRTDILQLLRVDYTGVHTDFEAMTNQTTKLQADNSDLVLSNSKLFRQLGVVDNSELKEKEEVKDFSQSITLESLEKGE